MTNKNKKVKIALTLFNDSDKVYKVVNADQSIENEETNEIREEQKSEEKLTIEDKRVEFLNKYKSDKNIQLIVSIFFIVLCLLGLFLLLNYPSYLIFTFLGILICFVGLSTYSKSCARKKERLIKGFVNEYRNYENQILYDDKFTSLSFDPYKELARENIDSLNLFKKVHVLESNNYVDARYLNKEYKSTSVAIYKDKLNLALIGKYYSIRLDKVIEGRIIINKDSSLQLNLEGLKDYSIDNYQIFSSLDKEEFDNVINDNIYNILNGFVFDDNTKNVCIMIEKNYLKAFVHYDNKFVDVPVETKVDGSVIAITKDNMNRILDIYNNI